MTVRCCVVTTITIATTTTRWCPTTAARHDVTHLTRATTGVRERERVTAGTGTGDGSTGSTR